MSVKKKELYAFPFEGVKRGYCVTPGAIVLSSILRNIRKSSIIYGDLPTWRESFFQVYSFITVITGQKHK